MSAAPDSQPAPLPEGMSPPVDRVVRDDGLVLWGGVIPHDSTKQSRLPTAPPLAAGGPTGGFVLPSPLASYASPTGWTPPPATLDNSAGAIDNLHHDFGNRSMPSCVPAAVYHCLGVITARNGSCYTPPEGSLTEPGWYNDFITMNGYNPEIPDSMAGLYNVPALNYFGGRLYDTTPAIWTSSPGLKRYRQQGRGLLNGTKVMRYVPLHPNNRTELKKAIQLFGAIYIVIQFSREAVEKWRYQDGYVWTYDGEPAAFNHAVCGYGYNDTGILVSSWGCLGTLTWEALWAWAVNFEPELRDEWTQNYYLWNTFALLTQSQIAYGQTVDPNGLNWERLKAEFNALGDVPGEARYHVRRGRHWRLGRRGDSTAPDSA